MDKSAPVFITPECHASGCHNGGDQFTMVKCRSCNHWFCAEHLESNNTIRRSSFKETGVRGLSYYLGLCADCSGKHLERRAQVDSSWLK